jgi:hypothetical protein
MVEDYAISLREVQVFAQWALRSEEHVADNYDLSRWLLPASRSSEGNPVMLSSAGADGSRLVDRVALAMSNDATAHTW